MNFKFPKKLKSKNKKLYTANLDKTDRKNIEIINIHDLYKRIDEPINTIDLNKKVDEFINWYYENIVKDNYTDIGKYHKPIEMRNFIEKIAVWYELRYPEYEINRIMECCRKENININDVMFKNNPYINDFLNEESDVKELDWDEFYNTHVFINSLPFEERRLLVRPWYGNIAYLTPIKRAPFNLYLTRNGFVRKASNITEWTNSVVKDEELIGLHVKKVIELFNDRGINLPEDNMLEEMIDNIDKHVYRKEEILNCAMYRIIERGGNRIGPRRAFLFAKEFGRNIDIPMMYGIDCSDSGLRLFMNEYLKAGGSKNLKCYVNYFDRTNKDEEIKTTTIKELFAKLNSNHLTIYSPEEKELHQRLVNAISDAIDYDLLRKEEAKKLRLERKLERSKRLK